MIDIFPVELVEHFMPSERIETNGDIGASRIAECLVGSIDTCTLFAHRILFTGHEIDGLCLIHPGQIIPV